jgi:hypothetical protein
MVIWELVIEGCGVTAGVATRIEGVGSGVKVDIGVGVDGLPGVDVGRFTNLPTKIKIRMTAMATTTRRIQLNIVT